MTVIIIGSKPVLLVHRYWGRNQYQPVWVALEPSLLRFFKGSVKEVFEAGKLCTTKYI